MNQPRYPALKHRPTAQLIYRTLVLPALWRAFDRIAIQDNQGVEGRGLPTILYANHVSWWDGYFFFLLEQSWRAEFYLMMEEAQLSRYRFFQQTGCFSVDRADPREAMRSVQYAAQLLAGKPRRTLIIFPQGVIVPNDRRPLDTYPGVAHIAKRAGAVRCLPIALRLEFGQQQRPEGYLRIGPGHVLEGGNTRAMQAELDRRLLHEVDALRDDFLAGRTDDYATLLHGMPSVNVLWDRLRGKGRGVP